AKERHVEGGAHALVADVRDDERDGAVGRREAVVEVAAHLPRRLEHGGDLPSGRLRQGIRQEVALDLAPDLELPLEAANVEALAVFEALTRESGRDARAKHDGVEGFGEVVGGAEL